MGAEGPGSGGSKRRKPCGLAGIHWPSVPSCLTYWQESNLRHSFRNQHCSSGPHEGGGPESPHWMDTVLWGLQTLHSPSPAPASPLGRVAVPSLGAYRGQSRPLPTLLRLRCASLLAGPRGRLDKFPSQIHLCFSRETGSGSSAPISEKVLSLPAWPRCRRGPV